jgi:hypothetical protein
VNPVLLRGGISMMNVRVKISAFFGVPKGIRDKVEVRFAGVAA